MAATSSSRSRACFPSHNFRAELQAAHDYLAKARRAAVAQLGIGIESWGAGVKRVRVALDDAPPLRVSRRGHHNFVEVVNQPSYCSNIRHLWR